MGGLKTTIKKIFNQKNGRIGQAWDFKSDGQILGGAVVEDLDGDGINETIFGTKKGEIFCLDHSGKPKWKFNVHENLTESEMMFFDEENLNSINTKPCVSDLNSDGKKEIVFGSEMGWVYCLNYMGQLLWKFKAQDAIRGGIISADIASDGSKAVVFGSMDSYLYVLAFTGKLLWRINTKAPIESTPCFYPQYKQIIFGTNDGTLYCVNSQGKLAWGYRAKAKITAQPIVAKIYGDEKEYVLFGSYDGYLYVLENSGLLKWSYPSNGPIVSAVTVFDTNQDGKLEIYFGSCDNKVYALNYQGDKLWDFETNFWVVESPVIADIDGDGRAEVLVGSYDNVLYVLDPKGNYELEFVPGLSGVVHQSGHYSDIMTHDPGKLQGKKIYEYHCHGVITGLSFDVSRRSVIVAEKLGDVQELRMVEEK